MLRSAQHDIPACLKGQQIRLIGFVCLWVCSVVALPATAFACPLCQDELNDPTAAAFSFSAVLMLAMPFLLMGFLGLQLVRAMNPRGYEEAHTKITLLFKPRWVRSALILVFSLLVYYSFGLNALAALNRPTILLPRTQLAAQTNLNGSPITLAQLENKVVIVNFFASWCTPCKQEVNDLGELYREYDRQGVEIIGIALDFEHQDEASAQPHIHPDGIVHFHAQPNQLQLLLAFLRSNRVTYPVVPVAPEISEPLGDIKAIPATYVFDRRGLLTKTYFGPPSMTILKTELQKLSPD